MEGIIDFTLQDGNSMCILPNKDMATISLNRELRLWNMDTQVNYTALKQKNYSCKKILKLSDQRSIVVCKDTSLMIYSADFKSVYVLQSTNNDPVNVYVLLDDIIVIIDHRYREINLFDPHILQHKVTLRDNTYYRILTIFILPDGRLITGSDSTLKMWNLSTHECEKVFEGHKGYINDAKLLPSGKIITASTDTTLKIWNLEGICEFTLTGHTKEVNNVRIIQGKIYSSSADYTIRVWSVDGVCEMILNGHTKLILQVKKLPDGRLISSSYDKTMRLWNLQTGICERVIPTTHYVYHLLIHPSGRIITRTGTNIQVWK